MYKYIVGIENIKFKTKDGEMVEGDRIHTTEDIPVDRGTGKTTENFFLSSARPANLGFVPTVGDSIEILYNKFGKVQTIRLIDNIVDLG